LSKWQHPKNHGWDDIDYQLLDDPDSNARVAAILNVACHVFRRHADGNWQSHDKDVYARQLADEIDSFPGLIHRLLGTNDRVIKMLTFRAIELRDAAGPDGTRTN
jgi:hypothetical protein